jgi:hypothetical protein
MWSNQFHRHLADVTALEALKTLARKRYGLYESRVLRDRPHGCTVSLRPDGRPVLRVGAASPAAGGVGPVFPLSLLPCCWTLLTSKEKPN